MELIVIGFLVFCLAGWVIGKIVGNIILPKHNSKEYNIEDKTVIEVNNYIQETHQHLHVDEKTLTNILKKKS